MKRLILAAGLFAATLTASLHAQTMNMQASIPFDFQIGNTAFPSGEYGSATRRCAVRPETAGRCAAGSDRRRGPPGNVDRPGHLTPAHMTCTICPLRTPSSRSAGTSKDCKRKGAGRHIGQPGTSTVSPQAGKAHNSAAAGLRGDQLAAAAPTAYGRTPMGMFLVFSSPGHIWCGHLAK
jgi:hypothetical protein